MQKHLSSTHYRYLFSTLLTAGIFETDVFQRHSNSYWTHTPSFRCPPFSPTSSTCTSQVISPVLYFRMPSTHHKTVYYLTSFSLIIIFDFSQVNQIAYNICFYLLCLEDNLNALQSPRSQRLNVSTLQGLRDEPAARTDDIMCWHPKDTYIDRLSVE